MHQPSKGLETQEKVWERKVAVGMWLKAVLEDEGERGLRQERGNANFPSQTGQEARTGPPRPVPDEQRWYQQWADDGWQCSLVGPVSPPLASEAGGETEQLDKTRVW